MEVPTTAAGVTIQLGLRGIEPAKNQRLLVDLQRVDLRKNSKQGSGSSSRKYARPF